MKVTKTKKLVEMLIIILTSILGAILITSLGSLVFFHVTSNLGEKKMAVGAVGFASGNGSYATPYVIETKEQLDYFASQVSSGVTYAGQYIEICEDVDYIDYFGGLFSGVGYNANSAQGKFSGNFNGNGCAIRSFTIDARNVGVTDSVYNIGVGFFAYLQTTSTYSGFTTAVKNLELEDFNILVSNNIGSSIAPYTISIGGIAGCLNGEDSDSDTNRVIIENCSVKGMEIVYDKNKNGKATTGLAYEEAIEVGGLIGQVFFIPVAATNHSRLTLQNCEVEGLTAVYYDSNSNFEFNSNPTSNNNVEKSTVGAFVGYMNNYSDYTFRNCVASQIASNMGWTDTSNNSSIWYGAIGAKGTNNSMDLSSIYVRLEGGRWIQPSSDNSFSGITNKSSISGENNSNPWYYSSEYNEGVPKLRKFIIWKECMITCTDSTAYVGDISSVSGQTSHKIWIPNDVDEAKTGLSSISSPRLIILGQTVYVNAAKACSHSLARWSATDAYHYFVSLYGRNRSLNFATTVSGAKYYGDAESGKVTFQCGTKISITGTPYAAPNAYKNITISYTDSQGNERTVQYTVDSGYYIEVKNLHSYFSRIATTTGDSTQGGDNSTFIILHDDYNFTPKVVAMDYILDMQ